MQVRFLFFARMIISIKDGFLQFSFFSPKHSVGEAIILFLMVNMSIHFACSDLFWLELIFYRQKFRLSRPNVTKENSDT